MKTPLRVLHLEDNPLDAELIRRELEKGEFACEMVVARTKEEFQKALEGKAFGLILSDYSMPGYDGLSALSWAQQNHSATPFIFVSGTIGEEKAVNSLKRGATDYVSKHRLFGLSPALRRALTEAQAQAQGRQAEEKLRQGQELFRKITENVEDLITVLDLDGRRIFCSPSYLNILAEPQSAVTADSLIDIHSRDAECIRQIFKEIVGTGVGQRAEYHWVQKDGTQRFIESQGTVIRNPDGQISNILVVSRDVTERREAEAKKKALVRDLEEKNTQMERFLYMISHDLKSPLITIKCFVEMVVQNLASSHPERVMSDLERIKKAANRMSVLLDELLTFARVGKVFTVPEAVSFTELAEQACEQVAGQMMARGVVVDIQPQMPTLTVDRSRMLEVLQNLLDNASKFMGAQAVPHIQVGADCETKPIRFFVRDNGIGIEKRHQERIFGLFDKLNPVSEGSGLGLALVRRIIEIHGGKIWIESEGVGLGSTFWFTLSRTEDAL